VTVSDLTYEDGTNTLSYNISNKIRTPRNIPVE